MSQWRLKFAPNLRWGNADSSAVGQLDRSIPFAWRCWKYRILSSDLLSWFPICSCSWYTWSIAQLQSQNELTQLKRALSCKASKNFINKTNARHTFVMEKHAVFVNCVFVRFDDKQLSLLNVHCQVQFLVVFCCHLTDNKRSIYFSHVTVWEIAESHRYRLASSLFSRGLSYFKMARWYGEFWRCSLTEMSLPVASSKGQINTLFWRQILQVFDGLQRHQNNSSIFFFFFLSWMQDRPNSKGFQMQSHETRRDLWPTFCSRLATAGLMCPMCSRVDFTVDSFNLHKHRPNTRKWKQMLIDFQFRIKLTPFRACAKHQATMCFSRTTASTPQLSRGRIPLVWNEHWDNLENRELLNTKKGKRSGFVSHLSRSFMAAPKSRLSCGSSSAPDAARWWSVWMSFSTYSRSKLINSPSWLQAVNEAVNMGCWCCHADWSRAAKERRDGQLFKHSYPDKSRCLNLWINSLLTNSSEGACWCSAFSLDASLKSALFAGSSSSSSVTTDNQTSFRTKQKHLAVQTRCELARDQCQLSGVQTSNSNFVSLERGSPPRLNFWHESFFQKTADQSLARHRPNFVPQSGASVRWSVHFRRLASPPHATVAPDQRIFSHFPLLSAKGHTKHFKSNCYPCNCQKYGNYMKPQILLKTRDTHFDIQLARVGQNPVLIHSSFVSARTKQLSLMHCPQTELSFTKRCMKMDLQVLTTDTMCIPLVWFRSPWSSMIRLFLPQTAALRPWVFQCLDVNNLSSWKVHVQVEHTTSVKLPSLSNRVSMYLWTDASLQWTCKLSCTRVQNCCNSPTPSTIALGGKTRVGETDSRADPGVSRWNEMRRLPKGWWRCDGLFHMSR